MTGSSLSGIFDAAHEILSQTSFNHRFIYRNLDYLQSHEYALSYYLQGSFMLGTEFRKCVIEGNLKQIVSVSDPKIFNEADEHRNTPLMLALIHGQIHVARHLLMTGCEVITVNSAGFNALQLARKNSLCQQDTMLLNLIKAKIFQEAANAPQKYGEIRITDKDEILGDVALLNHYFAAMRVQEEAKPAVKAAVAEQKKTYAFNPSAYQKLIQLIRGVLNSKHNIPISDFTFKQGIHRNSLTLPPDFYITLDDKIITKVDCLQTCFRLSKYVVNFTSTRLILTWKTGNSTVIPIYNFYQSGEEAQAGREKSDQLRMLMDELGGTVHFEHGDIESRQVVPWSSKHYLTMYHDATTIKYYSALHQYAAKRLFSLVPLYNTSKKDLTLYSFGCGDGKELEVAQKALADITPKVKAIGIDINPMNFPTTRAPANIQYIQGDMTQLEAIVHKNSAPTTTFNVGLFFGSLHNKVMKGTFHALSIIQQTRILDLIIIGGWSEPLLSKSVLKAVGFCVDFRQTTNNLYSDQIPQEPQEETRQGYFELRWMDSGLRKEYLINRSIKRSRAKQFDCLDLSFSANPLADLQQFDKKALEKVTLIDISWCYLKETEINGFFQYLAQLNKPNLKLLVSSHQVNFDKIMQIAKTQQNIEVNERLDAANADEIPIFKPSLARKWGMYTSLPNRKLK